MKKVKKIINKIIPLDKFFRTMDQTHYYGGYVDYEVEEIQKFLSSKGKKLYGVLRQKGEGHQRALEVAMRKDRW